MILDTRKIETLRELLYNYLSVGRTTRFGGGSHAHRWTDASSAPFSTGRNFIQSNVSIIPLTSAGSCVCVCVCVCRPTE